MSRGGGPAPKGDPAHPLTATDCASPAQYQCDPTTSTCSCNLLAPTGPCDCDLPGEFRCAGCLSGPPILGRCPYGDGTGCFCNASIAIAGPSDCQYPEQFTCMRPPPIPDLYDASAPDAGAFVDPGAWFRFADCLCDTARPVTSADCPPGEEILCEQGNQCAADTAAARLGAARFDCSCVPIPVPIR
jgi:hypothetical protein